MPEHWGANLELPKPAAFRKVDGSPASHGDWVQWLDTMADDLATFLWPRWRDGAWQGAAVPHMVDLTKADLALMPQLGTLLKQTVAGTNTTHEVQFRAEDARPPSLEGFLLYAPEPPTGLAAGFNRWLLQGGADFADPVSKNMKRRMQRPRPYQAALQMNPAAPLAYSAAASATSPSMISGHCVQGAMALVNVVLSYEAKGGSLSPQMLALVQRYFIDTGDRRVFAGVHFPTDNLSSWIVALRLCQHVFDSLQARRARVLLGDAIRRSAVYLAMKTESAANQSSPLVPGLQQLDAECGGDAATVSTAAAKSGSPKSRRSR
jgi:hypothetical protein